MPKKATDRFLLLASDGVWDMLSNAESVDIAARGCADCKVGAHLSKSASLQEANIHMPSRLQASTKNRHPLANLSMHLCPRLPLTCFMSAGRPLIGLPPALRDSPPSLGIQGDADRRHYVHRDLPPCPLPRAPAPPRSPAAPNPCRANL